MSRLAKIGWRRGGPGLVVAASLVWIALRLGAEDPEIALMLGEPWEDMRQRSSASIGPAVSEIIGEQYRNLMLACVS